MPVIHLSLGKDQLNTDQKTMLIREFTSTAVRISKLPEQAFTILIDELPPENIGVGGKTLVEKRTAMTSA